VPVIYKKGKNIMANVSIFDLNGTNISVKDDVARSTANSASAQSSQNAQDIADLKALSRLTVSYDANTETIAFSTTTH
jgi:hypothetical protein